jgi:hypothetical protein
MMKGRHSSDRSSRTILAYPIGIDLIEDRPAFHIRYVYPYLNKARSIGPCGLETGINIRQYPLSLPLEWLVAHGLPIVIYRQLSGNEHKSGGRTGMRIMPGWWAQLSTVREYDIVLQFMS